MRTIKNIILAVAVAFSLTVATSLAADCPAQGKCKQGEPCKEKCGTCEQCKGQCKDPAACKQKQADGTCKQDPAKCPMGGKK